MPNDNTPTWLDADGWREMRERNKIHRHETDARTFSFLVRERLDFTVLDETSRHYRVGPYDIWGTTQKWVHRPDRALGRGTNKMLADMKRRGYVDA